MNPTLIFSTPSDRELVFTRDFDAPRHLVFDCLSRPDLLRRWMLGPPGWTMPVCEIDFRVGGRFRYVWRKSSGTEMGMGGVYSEILSPERIVHVELFDQDWTGGETTVTTLLTEKDGRTTLTGTVLYSSKEARDGAFRTGMAEGMKAGYELLDELILAMQRGEAG